MSSMVRVVLPLPLIPGISGFLRICMVFTSGFFGSIELLNFLEQVVASCRDVGIRKWVSWLREDLISRQYSWLRPDFCSSVSIPCHQGSSDSVISDFGLNLILLMMSSAKLPFFL